MDPLVLFLAQDKNRLLEELQRKDRFIQHQMDEILHLRHLMSDYNALVGQLEEANNRLERGRENMYRLTREMERLQELNLDLERTLLIPVNRRRIPTRLVEQIYTVIPDSDSTVSDSEHSIIELSDDESTDMSIELNEE